MVPTNRQPVMAKTAAHVEQEAKQLPTLDEIAELTRTTYTAARYAPRNYDELTQQAEDAYDAGALRKEYYPPAKKKVARQGRGGYDWIPCKYTDEQKAAYRRKGVLQAVYVARRGAALGILPEAAWENIYMIDNVTMIGAHLMKAAVVSLPSCLEWSDEKLPDGWRMTVKRMLPSGRVQETKVEVHAHEFEHFFNPTGQYDKPKETWKTWQSDMLYASCVRRAGKHSFPDRLLGMGTKEEFVMQREAARRGEQMPTRPDAPSIDDLLEEYVDEDMGDAPDPPPPLVEPQASGAEAPVVDPAEVEQKALVALIEARGGVKDHEWDDIKARAAKLGEPHRGVVLKAWNAKQAALRASAEGGA